MPYIGRGPSKSGAFRILKDFSSSFNGSTTSFAIQDTNGTALSVATPQNLMIAVDGVMQEPGSAYTISGTNIVFGSAPQADATFWGVELGDIGGTSVSSSDQILVTATGHSFVVGRWMKATSTDGVYAYADCTTEPNAEVAGVIISVTTDTYTLQVHGTVTGDAVPAQASGTIMFLDASNGQMTTTETSTAGRVSKPLAIVTKNDSEMVILTYRGEVISSNVQTNAPNNATYVTTTANSTLTNEVLTSSLKIDDFAAGDDNTDLDSSTSRHGLLLKLGGGTTNFLRADGTWNAPSGGIASVQADGSPQLGANLDVNGHDIVSASNGDIQITPNGTGKTILDGEVTGSRAFVSLLTDLIEGGTHSSLFWLGPPQYDPVPNDEEIGYGRVFKWTIQGGGSTAYSTEAGLRGKAWKFTTGTSNSGFVSFYAGGQLMAFNDDWTILLKYKAPNTVKWGFGLLSNPAGNIPWGNNAFNMCSIDGNQTNKIYLRTAMSSTQATTQLSGSYSYTDVHVAKIVCSGNGTTVKAYLDGTLFATHAVGGTNSSSVPQGAENLFVYFNHSQYDTTARDMHVADFLAYSEA